MPKQVLIIDDEDDIRAVARMSIERVGGWDVVAADSGEQGIALAASAQPDAILLDSMMPGMDGAATIQRLKSDPVTQPIPVVFLTAKLQTTDRERYSQLGAEGVLAKPFDPMTLPSELAGLLGWSNGDG